MSALEDLLIVQEYDTALDQLRHRRAVLPQRSELAGAQKELASLAGVLAAVESERGGLDQRRAALDTEVEHLEQRLADLDRRLRSGDVTATRELTAMVEQSDALKRRRSILEDEELELMVALEPLEAEVLALSATRAELEVGASRLRAELAEAEAMLDGEISVAAGQRAAASLALPDQLMKRYEHLRTRLGGIGAARLVGGSCGGCHLAFSATELDQFRRQPPDAVVTCEQCGRILVR